MRQAWYKILNAVAITTIIAETLSETIQNGLQLSQQLNITLSLDLILCELLSANKIQKAENKHRSAQ